MAAIPSSPISFASRLIIVIVELKISNSPIDCAASSPILLSSNSKVVRVELN
uniref:Uncharacterized protein n=1 Tax=Arcella intermedia TaxID=1963864 RepID=A0A6B2LVF5_9EUKA